MEKRLPVLLQLGESIYGRCEVRKPVGALLAEVEELSKKNEFLALRKFVAGCIVRIFNEEKEIYDKVALISAVGKMSNLSVEYLSREIMIEYYEEDDYVEGLYPCPRCGAPHLAEIVRDENNPEEIISDTRDRMSNMITRFMESPEELIVPLSLKDPFGLTTAMGEEPLESFELEFPTLNTHIEAYNSVGLHSKLRFQFLVYGLSIKKVNGIDVDDSWRRTKGSLVFSKSPNLKEDTNSVSNYIRKYGTDPRSFKKICSKCGKDWRPLINTSNFFGSALQ